MPDSSRVHVDLVIVSTLREKENASPVSTPKIALTPSHLKGLVAEKVDGIKAVISDMSQTVRLVPADREDVKANLATCEKSRNN